VSPPEPAPAAFEDLLAGLEQTIAQLATGTAPLDELVAGHQKALQLLADASARLDELKARAELIARSLAGCDTCLRRWSPGRSRRPPR